MTTRTVQEPEERQQVRRRVLASFGAAEPAIQELLTYTESPFDPARLATNVLPLASEPHLLAWETYRREAETSGAFAALAPRFPQFQFPIQEGISKTEAYRQATLQGISPDPSPARGLQLDEPGQLRLLIHHSLAGPVPVLIAAHRPDFERLVRALSARNEPIPIPPSMGACIVKGYNNWDRVRRYRRDWEARHPDACDEQAWAAEFRQLVPRPELYQDRFIILSEGPYSGVPASALGLTEQAWLDASLTIRLQHECTHYLTLRLFGVMRNHPFDELIADYFGLIAAFDAFAASTFLRFMGLESFPIYRAGGRLENYRGRPPLSDAAFLVLQRVLVAAAVHVEQFDRRTYPAGAAGDGRADAFAALACSTLEEIATGMLTRDHESV